MSAIFSGVADLKKAFDQARMRREQGRSTLLFVDEIHRFNKSQQESFLPFVENGTITNTGELWVGNGSSIGTVNQTGGSVSTSDWEAKRDG